MMKTLQNINRIATALTVVAVLGLANSASAYYVEDVDSNYSAGDLMDKAGNPGSWVVGNFHGNLQSPVANGPNNAVTTSATTRRPVATMAIDSGGDPGKAIARTITADIVNNSYTFQADVWPKAASQFRIYLGQANATLGSPVATTNDQYYVELNRNNFLYINNLQAGGATQNILLSDLDPTIFDEGNGDDWIQIQVHIPDVTSVTKTIQVNFRKLGSSTWISAGTANDYTGTIEAVSLNLQAGSLADNFISGVIPEPTSLSLLAVGGWMLLLRRRRRA